jgi:hypothetical protein
VVQHKRSSTAATGNAALLAVAMALLSLILIIGNAMSRLAVSETQRILAGESQQELYYIAQAGVQEALGSRFYPRTNIQALMNANVIPPSGPGAVTPDRDPYYRYSGRVTTSELDGTKTVTGINRYIVLGGDPARNASTGEFFQTPQDYVALVSHADRISQDFFVISKGSVCLNDEGDVIYDDIQALNGAVSCNTGELRHQTLMSQFRVSREDPENPGDTIPNTLVQTVNYEGYNGNITLPMPVQFADGSIRTTFNFETEWFRTDSYAHLEKILVYPHHGSEAES